MPVANKPNCVFEWGLTILSVKSFISSESWMRMKLWMVTSAGKIQAWISIEYSDGFSRIAKHHLMMPNICFTILRVIVCQRLYNSCSLVYQIISFCIIVTEPISSNDSKLHNTEPVVHCIHRNQHLQGSTCPESLEMVAHALWYKSASAADPSHFDRTYWNSRSKLQQARMFCVTPPFRFRQDSWSSSNGLTSSCEPSIAPQAFSKNGNSLRFWAMNSGPSSCKSQEH